MKVGDIIQVVCTHRSSRTNEGYWGGYYVGEFAIIAGIEHPNKFRVDFVGISKYHGDRINYAVDKKECELIEVTDEVR